MSPFSPAVGQANDSFVSLSALHLMSDAVVFFPKVLLWPPPQLLLVPCVEIWLPTAPGMRGSPVTPAEHPANPKLGALEALSHLSPIDLSP